MNVDISGIAAENHRYAVQLATFQNVISYKKGSYNSADISFEFKDVRQLSESS